MPTETMSTATIADQVATSIADREETASFLEDKYLTRLSAVSSHLTDQYGRNLVLMLVASGAFVFLTQETAPKIALFGLTIRDPEIVVKALPAFIALLFAQVVDYFIGLRLVERTATEIVRQQYPTLDEGDLNLMAGLRDARSIEVLVRNATTGKRLRFFVYHIGASLTVLAALVPVVFLIYAYWKCFKLFHAGDICVWISLGVTVMLLFSAVLVMWAVYGSRLCSPKSDQLPRWRVWSRIGLFLLRMTRRNDSHA